MAIPVFQAGVFAPFPALETERLQLREVRSSDLPEILRLYADERIMRYRGAATLETEAEARQLLDYWAGLLHEKKGIRWAITRNGSEQLIGTAGFNKFSPEHFRGEIGYELAPQLWNLGLMTEALHALTGWGFEQLGLHSIEANIAPDNLASKRVLEKLGFVQEAHFRENYYYKGWWDSVIFSLRRSQTP